MNKNNWNYKNFNMVVELDIAGEFIYNGIKEFNRMKYITNDAPTFFSLYNISVGLERLQNNIETGIFDDYIRKYINDIQRGVFQDGIVLTDEIKEFLGRVVGSISRKYYQLVKEGSDRNNTFTYELRNGSKAQKVFLPEYKKKSLMEGQLNERISFKEILIYVRNSREKTAFFKYLDDINPLEFDPALIVEYLGELTEGTVSQNLIDDVEWLYEEKGYSHERLELVDLIGNPYVRFEYPDIEACSDILLKILKDKVIDDDVISRLNQHIDYIDDDVLEVLNEVKKSYREYKDGKYGLNVFFEQIQESYNEYQNFLINSNNEDQNN